MLILSLVFFLSIFCISDSALPTAMPTMIRDQFHIHIPHQTYRRKLFLNKRPTPQPTYRPTSQPTSQPSMPTGQPSGQPSSRPTLSTRPTGQPSSSPTSDPSSQPSSQPTRQPTGQPSRQPTRQPTSQPSRRPTRQPTSQPTRQPTSQPTRRPTGQPTRQPTSQPTNPTSQPTRRPTSQPSKQPTSRPSSTAPTTLDPTPDPSSQPTGSPSSQPSRQPTRQPTGQPSRQPTSQPTSHPSKYVAPSPPTPIPSVRPSGQPTGQPTRQPTRQPSSQPTSIPTSNPTNPTGQPTRQPTRQPTSLPTAHPTHPTPIPTPLPSRTPTTKPTTRPTRQPTARPTQPTGTPTGQPTRQPTRQPTGQPTKQPFSHPTSSPSTEPTSRPTPSHQPSNPPTTEPSGSPSRIPSSRPTASPSRSHDPSSFPTSVPSRWSMLGCRPTGQPSALPSGLPTSQPSASPTGEPTGQPTHRPTTISTIDPTPYPTDTSQPSISFEPTLLPTTDFPSSTPTGFPSSMPSTFPTSSPSVSHPPTGSPTLVTSSPTGLVDGFGARGSVYFDPEDYQSCEPLEIVLKFSFQRNVSFARKIIIDTPGLTSGDCVQPTPLGQDEFELSSSLESMFRIVYFEGSPLTGFSESHLVLHLNDGYKIYLGKTITIRLDKVNGLKRTCGSNSTLWSVSTRRFYDQRITSIGELNILDTNFPPLCPLYSSSLSIKPAFPLVRAGLNFSFYPSFFFSNGSVLKIILPEFSNDPTNFPTVNNSLYFNPLTPSLHAKSHDLKKISSSTDYAWSGSFHYNSSQSYLLLSPHGQQLSIVPIWISIDVYGNNIIPMFGSAANDTRFRVELWSSFGFNTSLLPIQSTDPVGRGCKEWNDCSGNGLCDFRTSTCRCFDGFGSESDMLVTNANTFSRDCSTRLCPLGRSKTLSVVGNLPLNSVFSSSFKSSTGKVVTESVALVECSGQGLCQRDSGRCQCFSGYAGSTCQRMTCPGATNNQACSGRGVCLPSSRLSIFGQYLLDQDLLSANESLESVDFVDSHSDDQVEITLRTNNRLNSSQYASFLSWRTNLLMEGGNEQSFSCKCDSSWPVGLGSGQVQVPEFFGPMCERRRCPSGDDPSTSLDETDCNGKSMFSTENTVSNSTNTSHVKNSVWLGLGVGREGNKCHVDCSNKGLCDYSSGVCSCFPGYYGHNCGSLYSSLSEPQSLLNKYTHQNRIHN